MNRFEIGQRIHVVEQSGKKRAGVIKNYGCRGNITGNHYWMVQIDGLKKRKVYPEKQLVA